MMPTALFEWGGGMIEVMHLSGMDDARKRLFWAAHACLGHGARGQVMHEMPT